MKFFRLAVAAAFALSFGNAYAFHSGGVAECDGCHTMHNSLGDQDMVVEEHGGSTGSGATYATVKGSAGPYLLQGTNATGACLNCHQHLGDAGPGSYHISTPAGEAALTSGTVPALGTTVIPANTPFQMTPGGDFGWLRKSYTWSPRSGTTEEEPGFEHGHNVIASEFGYAQDPRFTVSPGGSFPADSLACSSCHDPHGKFRRYSDGTIDDGRTPTSQPIANSGSYNSSRDPGMIPGAGAVGVYRILGGSGYVVKSAANYTFTTQVPAAVAPTSYNKSESNTQIRVAYGSGMSEWCGNCHGEFVRNTYSSTATSNHKHPAAKDGDAKLSNRTDPWGYTFQANYNRYMRSGGIQAGQAANSYYGLNYITDGNAAGTVNPNGGPFNSLVPVEMGETNYATLKTRADLSNTDYMEGATATATVQCLSCHRAHATGWANDVRWNMHNEFLTVGNTGATVQVAWPSYTSAGTSNAWAVSTSASVGRDAGTYQIAMYDRPASQFAPFQRSLCNKCHIKD